MLDLIFLLFQDIKGLREYSSPLLTVVGNINIICSINNEKGFDDSFDSDNLKTPDMKKTLLYMSQLHTRRMSSNALNFEGWVLQMTFELSKLVHLSTHL